jgi:hypothetical protein
MSNNIETEHLELQTERAKFEQEKLEFLQRKRESGWRNYIGSGITAFVAIIAILVSFYQVDRISRIELEVVKFLVETV